MGRPVMVTGPEKLSGEGVSMSVANSKKQVPAHQGFEWAGTVARMRRSGLTSRSGRRSALLGMLTASYANANRTGRAGEVRPGSGDRA